MPKILTKAAIAQYKRDGFYHPVRALDADEVAELSARCGEGGARKPR